MSGVHYRLNDKQEVERTPGHEGNCIAYLIERDGIDILCVMEGGAYHQYEISPRGVSRLAYEAANALRKHIR